MRIFTIFVLLLFSCNQAKNVYTKDSTDMLQTKQLEGSWQLCKRKFDNEFVVSNVCQTLYLNENNNGKLLGGDNFLCNFKWEIEKNLIKLSFDSSNSQTNFFMGELEYSYKLDIKGNSQYLEITSKNGIVYYLTRVKNIE